MHVLGAGKDADPYICLRVQYDCWCSTHHINFPRRKRLSIILHYTPVTTLLARTQSPGLDYLQSRLEYSPIKECRAGLRVPSPSAEGTSLEKIMGRVLSHSTPRSLALGAPAGEEEEP